MLLFVKKSQKTKEDKTKTVVVCPYCGGVNTIKHNEEADPAYNTEECTKCGRVEFHEFGVSKEIKEDD